MSMRANSWVYVRLSDKKRHISIPKAQELLLADRSEVGKSKLCTGWRISDGMPAVVTRGVAASGPVGAAVPGRLECGLPG